MKWEFNGSNLVSGDYTIEIEDEYYELNYKDTNIHGSFNVLYVLKMAEEHYEKNKFPEDFTFEDGTLFYKGYFVANTLKKDAILLSKNCCYI